MLKKEIVGKFEIRPDFDEDAYVEDRIAEIRTYFNRQLAVVDNITDTTIQLICMFSLIDCMAQEYFNYSEGSQSGMFSEFVLKHQCTFPYLDQVDPITLYYHVEESIEERVPLPGFAPEKVISLESLGDIDMKTVKDVVYTDLAKEILKYLEHKRGKAYAEKKAKEHRLINLLYRMRSKVTHEMTGLGEELSAHKREGLSEPYYRSILRSYVEDGMLVRDDVCELVIPNAFIRTLLEDCIAGYLEECRKVKHAPFSHNTMTRKHILSWYNK